MPEVPDYWVCKWLASIQTREDTWQTSTSEVLMTPLMAASNM
jgi:hypothetical protein